MTAKLNNTPIGTVFPADTPPAYRSVDARTAGLLVLKEYLSELTFMKPGDGGTAVPFQILPGNIHIEEPDYEQDLIMPALVFEGIGDATIDDMGFYDETSTDLFAKSTVLWVHAEHAEFINMRIWTASRAERRAILAGLEVAMAPVEEIYGMSLVAKNYYGQTVSICPISTSRDDSMAGQNRRQATFKIDLRINIVQLVNYRKVVPLARVQMGSQKPTS
jgi:hypothetical protein